MSRYHHQPSRHSMRAKWSYDHATNGGRVYWEGVSEWDMYYPGSRLRHPMSRATVYYDAPSARKWARRYKVEFPETPSITFADYMAAMEARRLEYARTK